MGFCQAIHYKCPCMCNHGEKRGMREGGSARNNLMRMRKTLELMMMVSRGLLDYDGNAHDELRWCCRFHTLG